MQQIYQGKDIGKKNLRWLPSQIIRGKMILISSFSKIQNFLIGLVSNIGM